MPCIWTFTKQYCNVYKTVYWRLQNQNVYKTILLTFTKPYINVYKTKTFTKQYIDVYKTVYKRLQNLTLTFTKPYINVYKTVYWRLQNLILMFTKPKRLQNNILTFTKRYINVYKTICWRLQNQNVCKARKKNKTKRSHKFSRLKNYFVYDCILICSFYYISLLVYSFGNTLSMIEYWYVVFTTWIYWSIQTQPIFFTLNYTYK